MKNYILKITLFLALAFSAAGTCFAQNSTQARQILDKTASVLNSRNGASANFSISGKGSMAASGSISIKGNKFYASTPNIKVWNNGKTQWTYTKSTNEVTISTPNDAQQVSANPYKVLSLYKNGYRMTSKTVGSNYEVHLTAMNPARSIPELYITITKSYHPTTIKMRQGKSWTTIRISNFRTSKISDATFQFSKSKCSGAEIVDLR